MKIFVSYRRSDSAAEAGRLSDRLVAHFGSGSVVRDVESIGFGTSTVTDAIEADISQCDAFLVLIGRNWLLTVGEHGTRRIDEPKDFIRLEIEAALRLRKPIVPVLVDGASFPTAADLPDSIRGIAYYNGIGLLPDPDYSRSVDRLTQALEQLVDVRSRELPDLSDKPVSVFVSHATLDRAWVEREIVKPLKAIGVAPWYSIESIDTASQWEREILKGLESCDWFLLVVSKRSASSEWIKDELNWAIYNRPTRIVPVIMEASNLWDFHIRLPRIQNIDFSGKEVDARQKLLGKFT